jgi:uncharacterized protein (TIGR04141 family)
VRVTGSARNAPRRSTERPRNKPKRHRLTIFRLRDGIAGPGDVLERGARIEKEQIALGDGVEAELYLAKTSPVSPRWTGFFEGTRAAESARSQTSGAALFVRSSERTFVLTFGQGRHFLNPDAIEENFGRRVTLNCVPESRIRCVESTAFDAIGKRSRLQASRHARLAYFGLNPEEELVRDVTGEPSDESLGKTMTGRHALSVSVATNLRSLPALLTRYDQKHGDDTHRAEYADLDQMAPVESKELVDSLDAHLVERLQEDDPGKLWMAVPEVLDWSGLDGFRYGSSSAEEPHIDLHVADLLTSLRQRDALTIERIKTKRISCIDGDGTSVRSWSAYECLYCEQEDGDEVYILTDRRWFRVRRSLVQSVTDRVKAIGDAGIVLPDFADRGEREYNERVARENAVRFHCLDRSIIHHGGGKSQFEFCDLLGAGGKLVHVKRYGQAPVFSHLFQQGVNSAELIMGDRAFREKLYDTLPAQLRSEPRGSRPDPATQTVVYAITSASAKPIWDLPFFSKLSLRNAARRLGTLGLSVALVKIRDVTAKK